MSSKMLEENYKTPTKKSTPERKILGELGNSNPDSPTANLRLLTTLATSLKCTLNSPCASSHTNNSNETNSNLQVQDPLEQQKESGHTRVLPRKEKSLSLLCCKFLNLFPLNIQENERKEISLNSTAEILGTEKRRIYDIINVLESLKMASKAGKNLYLWHGQSCLPITLAQLKMKATELGLDKHIQEIQRINRAYIENSCHSSSSSSTNLMVPQSPVVNYRFPENSVKEDKSLGVMCKKFVMLLLVSLKNGVINLDIAAKVLINEQDCANAKKTSFQSRYKTKVRRLYDIANVLSAIGLIEKVDLYNCVIRKPIFKYSGPSVDCINYDSETQTCVGMTTPSKRNLDIFKFHNCNRYLRLHSSTPSNFKREPKKRKLFESDSKFERAHSSLCLNPVRADDSFFRVVEMEYKRMKFSEHKPKVCTTLFPRHSSDSCIVPAKIEDSPLKLKDINTLQITNTNEPVDSSFSLPVVSKKNLVNHLQSDNINVTSMGSVQINVPLELKITPLAFTQKLQKTPKFVKLSKLDMKKLVPISHEDIQLKLASLKPVGTATSTTQKQNVAILTPIPTKDISPGEIYSCQAIKVGDTVQFVPIKSSNND